MTKNRHLSLFPLSAEKVILDQLTNVSIFEVDVVVFAIGLIRRDAQTDQFGVLLCEDSKGKDKGIT